MRLTLSEIAEAVRGSLRSSGEATESKETSTMATGITWDSREVKPGDLYVALPGERVDGHDFIGAAESAGAVAALVAREAEAGIPLIVVPDTAQALTDLAAHWRGKLAGTVVGLTGSTGKTTTKNLVRDVLSHHGSVIATKANQNNELGVPRTLLAADADTASVIVEMGMRGQGQIAELCKMAHPDWGLVTNVGESHIELLGSRENIAHAKAELLCALPDGRGVAFVNAADDYAVEVCRHAELAKRGVTTVFFEGGSAWKHVDELGIFENEAPFVWASDVALDEEGCPSFTLHARHFAQAGRPDCDGEIDCKLALRGVHNVSNACSAAAVGLVAGMTLAECRDALTQAQPEQGRQQVWHTRSGVTVVDDAYNANPDSMRASLSTFAVMDVAGKRIAVLGDMLELGDFSRECHERVGGMAAAAALDELVCVGELSQFIADAACAAGMDEAAVRVVPDAAAALEVVKSRVGSGDAVLVKASHSIGLERVVEGLVG